MCVCRAAERLYDGARIRFMRTLTLHVRGVRVRVHIDEHSYEGWYYNEHAVVIDDAERADGEQVGVVTLSDPETVERIPPTDSIEEVRGADIAPPPYTARTMDGHDHEQFVKLTRERGHLLTYPTVRPVAEDERIHDHVRAYEVVAGYRRFEIPSARVSIALQCESQTSTHGRRSSGSWTTTYRFRQ